MPFVADSEPTGRFVPDGATSGPDKWALIQNPEDVAKQYEAKKAAQPKGLVERTIGRVLSVLPGVAPFGESAVGPAETAAALATGATTGFAGGAANVVNNAVQHALSLGFGDEGVAWRKAAPTTEQAFAAGAAPLTYQPRSTSGQETTSDISDWMARNLGPLTGHAGELSTMARTAAPEAQAVGTIAKSAASKAAEAVTPSLSPEMSRLVNVADKQYDINFLPHQVMGGRIAEKAGEMAQQVPFSASSTEKNRANFVKGVIKQINPEETSDRLTQDVFAKALDRSGGTWGDVADRAVIPLPGKLQADLSALAKDAVRSGEQDSPRIIPNLIEDLSSKANENGIIPGTTVREAISDVGRKMRGTQNGDYRGRLMQLQDSLLDAVDRGSAPQDIPAYRQARKEYAIAKQIEPVVAKSIDGEFPPAALMGRVTATKIGKEYMAKGMGGDIGDLAKIGQLLKEPASSGTAERGLAYKAVAEPAKVLASVAGGYPLATAYNVLGPSVVRRMAAGKEQPLALPPAEPGLSLGFESPTAPVSVGGPLGDLTPGWQTELGAAPQPLVDTMLPAGLVPAVGELIPKRRLVSPSMPLVGPVRGGRQPLPTVPPKSTAPQQPVVPGRPDLPETMVSGRPAENAPDTVTGEAMLTPEAALARRTQEAAKTMADVERLRKSAPPEVANTLEAHAKHVANLLKIDQLETAAAKATDEGVKAALLKRAAELREKTAKYESGG